MKRSLLNPSLPMLGAAFVVGLASAACTQPVPSPTGSSSSELGGGGSDSGTGDGGGTDSGTTKDSGSASDGYAYAFVTRKNQDRHHAIELTAGDTETVSFAWHDAAGLAPPADLWVEASGRTILQISALGELPFVHAGLEVVPLVAGATYRVVFTRVDDSLDVTLVDSSDNVVLTSQTAPGVDVVLPAAFWRTSVVTDVVTDLQ